jgi:hypothetical protein
MRQWGLSYQEGARGLADMIEPAIGAILERNQDEGDQLSVRIDPGPRRGACQMASTVEPSVA